MAANPYSLNADINAFLQGKDEHTRELAKKIYNSLQESGVSDDFAKSLQSNKVFYGDLFKKALVPIFQHETSESKDQVQLKSLQELLISVIRDIFQANKTATDISIIEEILNKLDDKVLDMWLAESSTESIKELCFERSSKLSELRVKYIDMKHDLTLNFGNTQLKYIHSPPIMRAIGMLNHEGTHDNNSKGIMLPAVISLRTLKVEQIRELLNDVTSAPSLTVDLDQFMRTCDSALSTLEGIGQISLSDEEYLSSDIAEENNEKQETPERQGSPLSLSPRGVGFVNRIGGSPSSRSSSPMLDSSTIECEKETFGCKPKI